MKYLVLIVLSTAVLSCSPVTYYVVRHAEKAPVPSGADRMAASDPPLSTAGELRANDLRDQLKSKKPAYIFSTNYKRTRSTVQPLAEASGSKIISYAASMDSMNSFITRLQGIKKGNVVIAGHSNTIDDIANKLTGKTVVPGDLPETEYDNIFIIRGKGRKANFSRIKYGQPTP